MAVVVGLALVLQVFGGEGYGLACLVGGVLPVADPCEPAQLVVGSRCPHSQVLLADIARVGRIGLDHRLPHNYFAERYAPGGYFLDRCAIEISSGLGEELFV